MVMVMVMVIAMFSVIVRVMVRVMPPREDASSSLCPNQPSSTTRSSIPISTQTSNQGFGGYMYM